MEIAFLHRLGSGQSTDPAPLGNPWEFSFYRWEKASRFYASKTQCGLSVAVQPKVLFRWGCGLSGNQWKLGKGRPR